MEGAGVVLDGFGDAAETEKLRAALAEECGVPVSYSSADMSRPDDITAMEQKAEYDFGAVDILVNNAGIQHVSTLEEFPMSKWEQILAVWHGRPLQ